MSFAGDDEVKGFINYINYVKIYIFKNWLF